MTANYNKHNIIIAQLKNRNKRLFIVNFQTWYVEKHKIAKFLAIPIFFNLEP